MRCLTWLAIGCGLLCAFATFAPEPSFADDKEAAASDDKYSAEELKEIVGPIALYPDQVIGSVLAASTVPTTMSG